MSKQYRILIAVTGASGSIYAKKLTDVLLSKVARIYLIASKTALAVCQFEEKNFPESSYSFAKLLSGNIPKEYKENLKVFSSENLFAPLASGSSAASHMIVVPCSMGTLARIRYGISANLLERAADVMLKQKKPLIICPRETPLSTIHLENMLELSRMGAHIVPTMPAFYQQPNTIEDLVDFMVGRILEVLGIDHELYQAWNKNMC